MSDLIAVPTVEQINLEHQLANSKSIEAVQHATNCGLMLLQVKASKQHGEWLPWLNGEIESGRLTVKARQAQKYMQLASNTHRSAYLLEAPSIRAALELLSDKEPTEQQGTLIDVEAERQAREAAEAKAEDERKARKLAEQRAQEFGIESNERRKKIRELEDKINQQADLLNRPVEKPAPVIVEKEVIPADYEDAKRQAGELQAQTESLQKQLEALQKQQAQLVNNQVRAKLRERQQELQKLEKDKELLESLIARNQSHLDSLSSEMRRITVHQEVINGVRLELIGLAAFLNDIESISDPDTIKKWLALASMCDEASKAIDMVFGQHGTGLRKAP